MPLNHVGGQECGVVVGANAGSVSEVCMASELTIWMLEPKPVTLFFISPLKPSTTATETIMTASPTAMPTVAMFTPSEAIRSERFLLPYRRRAMKKGKDIGI